MIPHIPWYVTTAVVGTSVAIAAAVWTILSSAARRSGLPPAARRRVRIGAALFLVAWLGGAMLLAPSPADLVSRGPLYVTPLIPAFVGLSLAIVFAALRWSLTLRAVVAAVPLWVLHAAQTWRIAGVVFVVLHAQGQLPAHFALPAGWGDMAVGVTAPLLAWALVRHAGGARATALWWNVFGLLDLAVAVGAGTGFLSFELGTRAPAATAMGTLPMFLVPAFAVPLSLLLHVLALGRLSLRVWPAPAMAPTAAR